MRKFLISFLVLLVGAGLTTVMVVKRKKVEPVARSIAHPLVRTVTVTPREHRFTVQAQGTVAPRTEITLAAEVAGRVVSVASSFVTGGFFEADDVLLSVDPRDYELAVTGARATLAEAQVRLAREAAEAEVALKEWKALGSGPASPLLKREPQLAEAKAREASAAAALQKAELDLERCQVHAPFAGRILKKQVDTGQYVRKGDPVARIYAVDYAEVRLPLPLDQLSYLDLPVSYRGETDQGPQPPLTLRARVGNRTHEWHGHIVRTEGEIDARTRMVTAVARVENPYGRSNDWQRPPLAVGLFVHAEIEGRSAGMVFVAPRAALRGSDHLTVVESFNEEDGKLRYRLRFRRINLIRLEHDRVIFKGGLRARDQVCVSPLDAPTDGMEVRLPTEQRSGPTKSPAPSPATESQ